MNKPRKHLSETYVEIMVPPSMKKLSALINEIKKQQKRPELKQIKTIIKAKKRKS